MRNVTLKEALNGAHSGELVRAALEEFRTRMHEPGGGLQVDLTRQCNFSCTYCLVHQGKEMHKGRFSSAPNEPFRTPSLSLARFERILEEHPAARSVQLQGQGEPSMHAAWPAMIRRAKERGLFVYSFTNGLGFVGGESGGAAYRARLREAMSAGIDALLFSLDIGTPAEVEAQRRGLKYDRALKNLGWLRTEREKERAAMLIGVSATITPRTLGELTRSLERFRDAGSDAVLISPLVTTRNYAGSYQAGETFSPEEYASLRSAVIGAAARAGIPALLSPDLCRDDDGGCALTRMAYLKPTEDGYCYVPCQNWHSGGPSYATKEEYERVARRLNEGVKAFVHGDRSAPPALCVGCSIPYINKEVR